MREDDIDTFLAARWSSLFRLACLLTGSPTEVDDLLQETVVKVYLRWTKISRTQLPEAYVRRVMVNTLVSRSRRPFRRRELLAGTVCAAAVVSPENAVLDRAQVWPLVCALPARQRAVIVLRYYEDLSEREIAAHNSANSLIEPAADRATTTMQALATDIATAAITETRQAHTSRRAACSTLRSEDPGSAAPDPSYAKSIPPPDDPRPTGPRTDFTHNLPGDEHRGTRASIVLDPPFALRAAAPDHAADSEMLSGPGCASSRKVAPLRPLGARRRRQGNQHHMFDLFRRQVLIVDRSRGRRDPGVFTV
jgi:RNA polymerase sigma factor (sigma-70 family)